MGGIEMQKRMKIKVLTGLLCCIFLSGCANGDRLEEQIQETGAVGIEESISEFEEEEQPEQATFGAVPYFDEDTDGMLQYADGWLYGYLGGSIFRMDADTGEVSVLFETAETCSMHFCIDDGFLYFLTIPQVTFVDGTKANLYRIKCDGSGLVLLAEALPVWDINISDWEVTIKMSVYEDVLYIMLNREAVCLQLLDDGSVREVACEDTLYGLLPDGYFAPYRYDMIPSIPYCAKHYGYLFAVNSEGRLIRVDAESGLWESIPGQTDYYQGFVTHEGVYLANREKQKWIRYSLEDVTQSSDWQEYNPSYSFYTEMIGWEEKGAFLIEREGPESPVQLVFADWEGKETSLVTFQQQVLYAMPYGMEKYYIRDGWLYYRDEWEGEAWLMRISCEGGEPEKLYCYYVRPDKGLTESETVEKNSENTGELRISTSITKLWLKEGAEGAAKINAALREIYKAAEAEMETFNQEMLDENLFEDGVLREDLDEWLPFPLEEWLDIIMENYAASIEYVDENYLCMCMTGDGYAGGSHGYYWNDYYVFDRHTGQRLSLEDFVSNSPEEIKEVVKAHILAVAPYSKGEQSDDALEQDRFFLSAEGIGIHYDVYEIGSYADGPYDLIIPFELFAMREDMWTRESIR